MSKYYKAEDIISFLNRYCPKDMWEYQIADLPTIEVSEDCISRKWLEENIEVVSHTNEWGETEIDEFVSWENIKQAPSVVPTTEQSSKVGEWLRKDGRVWSECSACGSGSSFETKFCGNCGANMKGEKE